MEPGKVNLQSKYGRQSVTLRDVFLSASDSTAFLRAYAFNENKSIKQTVSSGHRKVWSCTSSVCKWHVTLTKKAESKRENSKTSFCPAKAWFVSALNLEHSPSCDSVGNCSTELLMEMPGFRSSLVPGLSSARKRVSASVKVVDNVNVDERPALVYKAITRAKKLMEDSENTYDKIPSFLTSFERQNPGSRVCCQLDTKGRFYRTFLSIGSLIAAQDSWVPILECDGTHMKHAHYNGICVVIVGKDGDWANIPVGIAFIHKETTDNFEWFFANCIAAGIKLHDRPVFTDRGKQRGAQVRLRHRGIQINLKFCALHIFFNVCDRFRPVEPNIELIRPLVFRLQSATTLLEYDQVLEEVEQLFPAFRTLKGNGRSSTQTVAAYLQKIHPTSWTNVGNCSLTQDEADVLASGWSAEEAYGGGCPLFGGRTTSAVEGYNNALLIAGVRYSHVLGGLVLFCNMVIESLVTKRKNCQHWVKGKHTVTPRAKTMFDKQIWRAAVCSVRRRTDSVFYVDDVVGDTDKADADITRVDHQREKRNDHHQVTYTVDLELGSCTRCADRHHIQIPCRHLVAALYSQNGCPTSNAGAYKFSHPAFTVTSYVQAFANVSISMPFVPALLLNTNVQPPPIYNQAGKSSFHKQRDVARREKRIPSRGEPRGSRSVQIQTTSPQHQRERENVAASMRDFFNKEIRSAEKKKRAKYTCSFCGKSEGHNAARCPNRAFGDVDDDVQPGIYFVGNCPIQLLEQQNAFVSTEVEIPTIVSDFCF